MHRTRGSIRRSWDLGSSHLSGDQNEHSLNQTILNIIEDRVDVNSSDLFTRIKKIDRSHVLIGETDRLDGDSTVKTVGFTSGEVPKAAN